MKKILLLLSLVLVLTGCTVNYDLEIFNEEYNEKITIGNVNITNDVNTKFSYEIPIHFDEAKVSTIETTKKIDGVIYYQKEKINNIDFIYSNKFKMEDYYKSYFVNSSFDFFAVYYNDQDQDSGKDLITISTNFKMKIFDTYPELNDVKVRIKTNHKVKLSNADDVDKYTYTWNYNRDNYQDKAIQLILYKDKYVLNYDGKLYRILIMAGAIIGIVTITAVVLIRKSKKANKV